MPWIRLPDSIRIALLVRLDVDVGVLEAVRRDFRGYLVREEAHVDEEVVARLDRVGAHVWPAAEHDLDQPRGRIRDGDRVVAAGHVVVVVDVIGVADLGDERLADLELLRVLETDAVAGGGRVFFWVRGGEEG